MSAPICSVTCAADCCSDCASVLSAMNSTPPTSASIMRLTALTPPPPTPTTRSCGWPDVGPGRTSHSVVGRSAAAGSAAAGPSCSRAGRRRRRGAGAPAASGCAALGRTLVGGLDARAAARFRRRRRRSAARSAALGLRLPEEGGQRPLPHARPLTACHSRAPPSPAGDRRRPPCPFGSYLSTDIPFTGASANRTVFLMRAPNTRSPKFSSRISIASLACRVRVSTIVGRMPAMSHVRIEVLADHREGVLQLDAAHASTDTRTARGRSPCRPPSAR